MKVRDLFGAIGVMLGLIALYLILTRAFGASRIIESVAGGTVDIFRTLQGR